MSRVKTSCRFITVEFHRDDLPEAQKIPEAKTQAPLDRIPAVRGNILATYALRLWAEALFPNHRSYYFPDVDSAHGADWPCTMLAWPDCHNSVRKGRHTAADLFQVSSIRLELPGCVA